MITVTIWRKTLVRLEACAEALRFFDVVAAMQPAEDPRRLKRIRIRSWTLLHSTWPFVTGYSAYAHWLMRAGLIPQIGADLQGADLRDADLQGADLQGADLQGADLRGAYLQGADLQGAYLQGAHLQDADLQGAYLRGAYLQGADLQGAYRGDSSKIPGWRTLATGYLEEE